jgi:4-amino-4-deoxy-L-arabinose transferase-like glycosyltransferase
VTEDAPMKLTGEPMLLAAIVLAFLASTLAAIGAGIAFGYDEAVYAQLTRHWLTGAPASGWDLHRPPGLSVLGLIPQALSPETEWAPRLIGAIAGVGVVVAGWWAARVVGGRLAGTVAAVALAAAAPLQVESASFLTDVPSTTVLLVMVVLLWQHVSGPGPIGRSVAWLGLLAALAFYLRYGAVVELAGLALASVMVAPQKLGAAWRVVAAAVAVFLLALIPHFAVAITETGTPWGILASAGRAAGGGDGLPLLSYVAWFPWQPIGPIGAAVALIGIGAAIRLAVPSAFARFVGVAVLVPIVVLGTLVHPEARYLLFPMALLVVLGSAQVAGYLERRSRALNAGLAGLIAASLILGAATTAMEIRIRAETFDWKRDVGRDIGVVAGPARAPNCSIMTADVPIMSWYSGCHAVNFVTGGQTDRISLLLGRGRFVVVSADGPHQPSEVIAELVRGAEIWGTYLDGDGRPAAVVYRLPVR